MSPRIKVIGDRLYQLQGDYAILWEYEGHWHKLTVPDGFICDGNSVPWFGRPFIPGDWSLGLEPVLAHDFGYQRQGRFRPGEYMVEIDHAIWVDPLDLGDGYRIPWKREEIDRLFARLMRDDGVGKARRRMGYRAVRMAFWHRWNEEIWRWGYDD